jgi:manganese-dependent ADP-ribose/CDP-alcohol diphosphatase
MMKTATTLLAFFLLAQFSGRNRNPEQSTEVMRAEQKPLFSFGIIADVQYCDCDTYNTRFYRNSPTKLKEAVDDLKSDSPDFIINLGDLIDRDFRSFDPVLKILEDTGVKVYHTLGNHDYTVNAGDVRKVARITGSDKGYYSFLHEGFRFIVLNGNEIAKYAPTSAGRKAGIQLLEELRSTGAINAMDWNGAASKSQMEWLRRELIRSDEAGEKVFLICHFPVWPEGTHNLLNWSEVLEVLSGYDHIVAWFNGHNHDGGYGNFNMIHFVTFRGMLDTANENSYALIEVYSNKLWIRGEGREKSQILAY